MPSNLTVTHPHEVKYPRGLLRATRHGLLTEMLFIA